MRMITYIISGDTMALSDAVRAYIEKRFASFERFMDDKIPHEISVIVSKQTAHEREDSYRVEAGFKIHQREFFATGVAGEVYAAIDDAKEELMREVTQSNDRRRTLFHRGARKVKDLVKGLYTFRKKRS